jgi:hypothetical protein
MLRELGVVGGNPEGWGALPHHYIHNGGMAMLGKKLEVRKGLDVGNVKPGRLDIPKIDKTPLHKPKPIL